MCKQLIRERNKFVCRLACARVKIYPPLENAAASSSVSQSNKNMTKPNSGRRVNADRRTRALHKLPKSKTRMLKQQEERH